MAYFSSQSVGFWGRKRGPHSYGFTLVELMVAVAVTGILAAVALPSYAAYIKKSRAKSATADLAALALNMENRFSLAMRYPMFAKDSAVPAATFPAWSAGQAAYFDYTLESAAATYTLTATGKTGSSSAGCKLTLSQGNVRSASSDCGFTSW